MNKKKRILREQRSRRVRAKIRGTADRPRLSVFRSIEHIYAQMIDDESGKTLVSVSDLELSSSERSQRSNVDIAKMVGELVAKKARTKKISRVVLDRGWAKYHGRVKALTEGVREGGLKF